MSKFNDRWIYTLENGQSLYLSSQVPNSLEVYQQMNEGKTLWNPADIENKVTHSYFIEDGSFLRLQDITIGYSLPNKIISKLKMSRLRFYVSATNLFLITGYSGYDPEVDIQTGLTCGMDYNRYPRSRSFVFGANITF